MLYLNINIFKVFCQEKVPLHLPCKVGRAVCVNNMKDIWTLFIV